MDQLRASLTRGELVQDARRLLRADAADHGRWVRENLRHALLARRQDAVATAALTGLAPGTVRGFLSGRPSSLDNVLLMAEAVGYTIADLDRAPEEFRQWMEAPSVRGDGSGIGASLLAFDEAPAAMAIVLVDGTIVKVNRELRTLLGYEEGEMVGASAQTFSLRGERERAEWRDELLSTDALSTRATQLRRKDGSIVNTVTSALLVRDADSEPRYVIARAAPLPMTASSIPEPDTR